MEETRIDMRLQTPDQIAEAVKAAQLCFKLGQTMPYTPEYDAIVAELFEKNGLGEAYDVCLSLAPPDEEMISLLTDALSTTYKAMGDMVSYTALKWPRSHHS